MSGSQVAGCLRAVVPKLRQVGCSTGAVSWSYFAAVTSSWRMLRRSRRFAPALMRDVSPRPHDLLRRLRRDARSTSLPPTVLRFMTIASRECDVTRSVDGGNEA